jgi:glycosyltransferase involved in cell wall biosynthesis
MRPKPAISIVIPAFNEEKYLPKILESIKAQDFKDYETIVVLKPSRDKSLQIARKYGCIVSQKGGNPSQSRNIGAKIAKAGTIVFFDADNVLPKGFLLKLHSAFEQKRLGSASVFYAPLSRNFLDKLIFLFSNANNWLMQGIMPYAAGWCIAIKSDIFRKIGGFNESLILFEDVDLVRRASKLGKFAIIPSLKILVSVRRYEKEGRLAYIAKALRLQIIHALLGKEGVQGKVSYEFGKF